MIKYGDWNLIRAKDIKCFSNEHIFYIMIAMLGLAIYYPLASFFHPNL